MSDDLLNPFEDAVSRERWVGGDEVPPDGGFLWRVSGLLVKRRDFDGARFPEGYGLAWIAPHEDRYVLAPVPWNKLIGFLYNLRWWVYGPWNKGGPLSKAWEDGVAWERRNSARRFAAVQVEFERAKQDEYRRGRQEMLRDLQEQAARDFRFSGRPS